MGGNHVKNFAGSSIANYYADGVNFHADGLPHEPKRSHLKKLHLLLAQHQTALLEEPIQVGHEVPITPVGHDSANSDTFAYVYKAADDEIVFLVNLDTKKDYVLPYGGRQYNVSANSITLIDAKGNELYNTAEVDATGLPTERVNTLVSSNMQFTSYSEPIPVDASVRPDVAVSNTTPLEQIRLTNDTYEYLLYTTRFELVNAPVPSGSSLQFVGRAANAYMVYMDGSYVGQAGNGLHISAVGRLA